MNKRFLLLNNKSSNHGGYKASNNFLNILKTEYNINHYTRSVIKNSRLNYIKLKIYYLLNTLIWKFTSKFYNVSITIPAFNFKFKKKFNHYNLIIFQYINEFISLKFIEKQSKKKLFFFLHDEWLFNGIFHFKDAKVMQKYKFLKFIDNYYLNKKKKIFLQLENVTIIGNCKWITKKAKKSSVLNNAKYLTIYNSVDINFFRRDASINYKKKFGLDTSKKYILFLAKGGPSNFRKGGDLFLKLLKLAPKNFNFITVSKNGYDEYENNFENLYIFNEPNNQELLKNLYLASDINLTLSKNECIPFSILESMSCGIPNVTSNVGGVSEAIEHKNTGWIYKNKSINSILDGINWLLSSNKIYKKISSNSRKKIQSQFSSKKMMSIYKGVFNDL